MGWYGMVIGIEGEIGEVEGKGQDEEDLRDSG
jgi:hypothetical protein